MITRHRNGMPSVHNSIMRTESRSYDASNSLVRLNSFWLEMKRNSFVAFQCKSIEWPFFSLNAMHSFELWAIHVEADSTLFFQQYADYHSVAIAWQFNSPIFVFRERSQLCLFIIWLDWKAHEHTSLGKLNIRPNFHHTDRSCYVFRRIETRALWTLVAAHFVLYTPICTHMFRWNCIIYDRQSICNSPSISMYRFNLVEGQINESNAQSDLNSPPFHYYYWPFMPQLLIDGCCCVFPNLDIVLRFYHLIKITDFPSNYFSFNVNTCPKY